YHLQYHIQYPHNNLAREQLSFIGFFWNNLFKSSCYGFGGIIRNCQRFVSLSTGTYVQASLAEKSHIFASSSWTPWRLDKKLSTNKSSPLMVDAFGRSIFFLSNSFQHIIFHLDLDYLVELKLYLDILDWPMTSILAQKLLAEADFAWG
ncbi:hypothetical protein ACJX0J_038534, partial [Zea mays]